MVIGINVDGATSADTRTELLLARSAAALLCEMIRRGLLTLHFAGAHVESAREPISVERLHTTVILTARPPCLPAARHQTPAVMALSDQALIESAVSVLTEASGRVVIRINVGMDFTTERLHVALLPIGVALGLLDEAPPASKHAVLRCGEPVS